MSAECLNGGCLSGLETGESFCLQWDLIFVDSGIIECYKLCSLPMPSPVISKNTLQGPTPHHHLSNCSVYTRKKSWIVCMGKKKGQPPQPNLPRHGLKLKKSMILTNCIHVAVTYLTIGGGRLGPWGRGYQWFLSSWGGLKVQNA
jgi:hypothetical protein